MLRSFVPPFNHRHSVNPNYNAFTVLLCTSDLVVAYFNKASLNAWASPSAGDVHDFGYCVQGAKHGFDKVFWDKVFYHLMIDIGMPKWRAKFRYAGVRVLGHVAYAKRRKEKYQSLRIQSVSTIITEWGV